MRAEADYRPESIESVERTRWAVEARIEPTLRLHQEDLSRACVGQLPPDHLGEPLSATVVLLPDGSTCVELAEELAGTSLESCLQRELSAIDWELPEDYQAVRADLDLTMELPAGNTWRDEASKNGVFELDPTPIFVAREGRYWLTVEAFAERFDDGGSEEVRELLAERTRKRTNIRIGLAGAAVVAVGSIVGLSMTAQYDDSLGALNDPLMTPSFGSPRPGREVGYGVSVTAALLGGAGVGILGALSDREHRRRRTLAPAYTLQEARLLVSRQLGPPLPPERD